MNAVLLTLIVLVGLYVALSWLCIVSLCQAAAYGDRTAGEPGDGQ
jgi:hypothetical protein